MFSSLSPWAFAYINGKKCVVIGFQVYADGTLHPVVTVPPAGELLVANLYEVKMDLKKIIDLTAPPSGDEWKR
jgi:hypothetical protein